MNTEEIKAMKISRTDLVKTCAAEQMRELEAIELQAEAEHLSAREQINKILESSVLLNHQALLKDVAKVTGGRIDQIAFVISFDPTSQFAYVNVTDGSLYDYNFKLQFKVDLQVARLELTKFKIAMKTWQNAVNAADDLAAMTTKAREDLIKEALDSTDEGREALDALLRMRRNLK